jgi:hypothetical protein
MKEPAMTTKEHLTKHDKEIAEIWALLGKMAKGMLDFQAGMREFHAGMRELRAAQKRTDASLKAFIDSMRRGGNGNGKRKIDLQ